MNQTKTHWKKTFNKDYLGSHDLDEGKDLIATVDHIEVREVKDTSGSKSKCNVAIFKGNVKPMILNVTNCKIMKAFAGSNYIEDWNNIPIQIYSTDVNAFGSVVEGLRIRQRQPNTEKPEMTPEHPKWNDAVNYLKQPGKTIKGITDGWKVSEENIAKLLEAAL